MRQIGNTDKNNISTAYIMVKLHYNVASEVLWNMYPTSMLLLLLSY